MPAAQAVQRPPAIEVEPAAQLVQAPPVPFEDWPAAQLVQRPPAVDPWPAGQAVQAALLVEPAGEEVFAPQAVGAPTSAAHHEPAGQVVQELESAGA